MWRHIASNALTLLLVGIFLLGGLLLWAQNAYEAAGPLDRAICVDVPRGSTMARLSETLEERAAVRSAVLFRLGADYSDKAQALKAGSFLVPARASMAEIVEIVTGEGESTCGTEVVYRIGITRATVQVRELDPGTGDYVERAAFDPAEGVAPDAYRAVKGESDTRYRVVLAEGVTSWHVVQELEQIDILEGSAAVPVEGSLAPNSYEVTPGAGRAALIDRMQRAQQAILAEAWESRAPGLPYDQPREALIMASIVEKETGNAQERFDVASVFVNRLERGMRLQTDPTVIYGITRGEGVLGRGLRRSELDRETPYNTYRIDGLPPTPIANPGRAAIEAALNPADTDYLYFVAKTLDPADGHNFAETLEAHNRNVAAYRALERAAD